MTASREPIAEMESLLAAAVDGRLTESDRAKLGQMLEESDNARDFYVEQVMLHAVLRWVHASPLGIQTASDAGEIDLCGMLNPDQWMDAGQGTTSDFPLGRTAAPATAPAFPPLLTTSPSSQFGLSAPMGGFVFSYVLAAMIVGVGMLVGWAWQVSNLPAPSIAKDHPQPLPTSPVIDQEPVFVGRITAMADCKWPNPRLAPVGFDRVALDCRYELASGLMEITYDSGAKVILQGPCSYRVDSATGGYLTVGMVTARIEKKEEGRYSSAANGSSPQSTRPSPLFAIRTPTATVSDLGTEFGVEVDKSGISAAHVYRGRVEMCATGNASGDGKVIALGENESARVVIDKNRGAKVVRDASLQPKRFVRQMPRRERIRVFSTGVNLKNGEQDPHWQIMTRSDEPNFKPRPAVASGIGNSMWLANQFDRSQWISLIAAPSILPDDATFTFRTTFDLTGLRPSTATLHGQFTVDNHVEAIRLNGHKIAVPHHGYRDFGFFHAFTFNRDFVDGVNVLEFDVSNGDPDIPIGVSAMMLIVELEGTAQTAWPEASPDVAHTEQKSSKN